MEYLGFMNGKEAIRLAKEVSGLTESQIAAGLGVSVSVVKRYLKKDDAYFPSLESVFGNFSFYSYKKACGQKKTVRGSKNSRRLSNGTPAI